MQQYIYSIVLADRRGNVKNLYGVVNADSRQDAESFVVRTWQNSVPGYTLVTYGVMSLTEALAAPLEHE